MNILAENLNKSAMCADLLLSDIRQAHSAAVKPDADPLTSQLATIVLLDLIEQTSKVKRCLEALSSAANSAKP
jgi:hypothetical protein